ncbi:MAG: pantoate--beta-alanine ligase [Gammaproteobacteria bacterium]|nr:pantoate--beta-alanine ligase [Gammaproteobacteria bacterium]
MQSLQHVTALRALVAEWRSQGQTIGFVPTMGSLHKGHRSLIVNARSHCDRVIVSIFVNPTQFSAGEDFSDYPRTIDSDQLALIEDGVDALFLPQVEDLYPCGVINTTTMVSIAGLNNELCGAHRDGHFDGVLTVVNKFLNIITPDRLFLGEKDFQQLYMVKQMVLELILPVEVVGVSTYREADGLAMSSRNQYLTNTDRTKANGLYNTLCGIRHDLMKANNDFSVLENQALASLRTLGFVPDYIEVRRQQDMAKAMPNDQELVVLGAAKLGKTRLIDNVTLSR